MNWHPHFPDVLRTEMEWDRRRDPDKYAHIWLGASYSALGRGAGALPRVLARRTTVTIYEHLIRALWSAQVREQFVFVDGRWVERTT